MHLVLCLFLTQFPVLSQQCYSGTMQMVDHPMLSPPRSLATSLHMQKCCGHRSLPSLAHVPLQFMKLWHCQIQLLTSSLHYCLICQKDTGEVHTVCIHICIYSKYDVIFRCVWSHLFILRHRWVNMLTNWVLKLTVITRRFTSRWSYLPEYTYQWTTSLLCTVPLK